MRVGLRAVARIRNGCAKVGAVCRQMLNRRPLPGGLYCPQRDIGCMDMRRDEFPINTVSRKLACADCYKQAAA